jgi:23S rRNA (adenine2030-N6)-methyltransferase
MFSYRHAFHAGNHADVLKHFVQVQLHKYMNQKDTAYTYVDTHAGAGVYALDSAQALKSGESEGGIARLWERDDLPPALAEYVDVVRALNPSGKLRYYPGSPWVADQSMRIEDRLRLFELHPADVKLLDQNVRKLEAHKAEQGERARGRRIIVDRADGFLSLKALLPPPSRRALVLCDPPYEVKLDYKHVYDAFNEALGRFPSGMYAIWYPVLQRMESRQFADRLKRLPAKEWLHVTLTVATPGPDGTGMHSSGMFILNPPYTLEATLRETMPYLVKVLGVDSGASFRIETGTQQTGALAGRVGLQGAGAPAARTGAQGTGAPAGRPGAQGAAGAAARPAAQGAGPRIPVGNARRASPLSGKGSLRLPGQPYESPARAQGEDKQGGSPVDPAKREARRKFYGTQSGTGNSGEARGDNARSGSGSGSGSGSRGAAPSSGPGRSPARPAGGPGGPRKPIKRNGPGRG